ncbi:hypothetical protein F3Y22_tig00110761pilonHSYRG00082 [Hibiscus syriacus]|uniref:Protein kinase domain-containing protein n=1 Tax=Hibiscus syriacus TaxID=106335 RepID=A0A6A2ZVT2_HIBSY|nr:hypothetical protein F3Y22_tig00110761pilonHSYRG00082 [Hibiscus syriacus]
MNNNSISGQIPSELRSLPQLRHFLLDNNNLTGNLPPELSQMPNLKIFQLDNNNFTGTEIPASYSNMSNLVKPGLWNCSLQGAFPDFNSVTTFHYLYSFRIARKQFVEWRCSLRCNPVFASTNQLNIVRFCGITIGDGDFVPGTETGSSNNSSDSCKPQSFPVSNNFEFVQDSPVDCFCAAPLGVGLQGPRLRLFLKICPRHSNTTTNSFNISEIQRIRDTTATFSIPSNDTFDPYELIDYCPRTLFKLYGYGGISKGALTGIILAVISFVVAVSLEITLFFYKRGTKTGYDVSKKQPSGNVTITTESVKEFSYEELEGATDYITGTCSKQDEQMLVYEFMPNGSLHDLLSDRSRHEFPIRLHIALGSAKGILYLHNEADPPIIHRDIEANNTLLDFKFTPKVSYFGISGLAPLPDAEGASAHVSTLVKGTPGYMDPEYFLTRKLTDKSDVSSFGIVFLELLTGMLPISHGRNIVRESMGAYSSECIKKFMVLALKSCLDDSKKRPTTLEFVRELEK